MVAKPRNQVIDGLKLTAAGLIVLHHVAGAALLGHPGSALPQVIAAIAYTGLFCFFAVSGYFHGGLGTRGLDWLKRRFVRLGVPYAFWTMFFLAGSVARHGFGQLADRWIRIVFFAGARGILWALPLLLYIAVVVELLVKTPTLRRLALLLAFLSMIYVEQTGVVRFLAPDDSLVFFVLAPRFLLTYLVGMEVRAAQQLPQLRPAHYYSALVVVAAMLAGMTLSGPARGLEALLICVYVIAAGLLLIAGATNTDLLGVSGLAWGGGMLVGIFVTHVVWLDVVTRLAPPSRYPLVPWMAVAWIACFGLAVGTTRLMSIHPLTRALVA